MGRNQPKRDLIGVNLTRTRYLIEIKIDPDKIADEACLLGLKSCPEITVLSGVFYLAPIKQA